VHRKLEKRFAAKKDVVFFHLQTVFEGEKANTPERGPREAAKYGKTPVAYDAHVDGARVSVFMHRFGTGGTPWTTVIDRKGKVRYNDFTAADADRLARLIDDLRKN
jgi:hypothetical protein